MQRQFRPSSFAPVAANRLPHTCCVLIAALGFAGAAAQADVIRWTGATDTDWSIDSNWQGGIAPGDEDIAEFYSAGAGNLDVTLSSGGTIDGLAFNADATDPVIINVTAANPLTLDGGAAMQISVLAGSHAIQGAGAGSGDPPELRVLKGYNEWHVAADASMAINARLGSNSYPYNNASYAKTGAGTLTLGGHNGGSGQWSFTHYGGEFTVVEGTLSMTHPHAAGHPLNAYKVNDGATLQLTGDASSFAATWGVVRLSGDGVGGIGALYVDRPGENTTFGDGNDDQGYSLIALSTDTTIGVSADSTFTVGQDISGGGLRKSLIKAGAGTLILTSDENAYGSTTVAEGTLTLAPGGELRFMLRNGGASERVLGTGVVNLDGLLRLDTRHLTDEEGAWNLVNVETLDETWGDTFGLAFMDGTAFTDQGGGVFTSGDWTFSQATGDLTLGSLACPADLDGDGDADVNDFFLYLDHFAAGDPDADINGDGSVDVNDFFAYLDLFAAGC